MSRLKAGNATSGGEGNATPQSSSANVPNTQNRNGNHRNGKGKNGHALMSDAQRKYIYRLLAEAGIEGEDAHEKVKERCQVNSTKEVTKAQAHKLIEGLLEEAKTREKAEEELPY